MINKRLNGFQSINGRRKLPAEELESPNGELSRVIAAAVVDQDFCRLLLDDPLLALKSGCANETFNLTPEETELVLSVQAPSSLADFAMQLTRNYNRRRRNKPD